MAEVYGVEHLLRLFGWYTSIHTNHGVCDYVHVCSVEHERRSYVLSSALNFLAVCIGLMLSFTDMEEESLTLLLSHMHKFLK